MSGKVNNFKVGHCHNCNKPLLYDPFTGVWIRRTKDGRMDMRCLDNIKRVEQ